MLRAPGALGCPGRDTAPSAGVWAGGDAPLGANQSKFSPGAGAQSSEGRLERLAPVRAFEGLTLIQLLGVSGGL